MKRILPLALAILLALVLCGCNITSGVFTVCQKGYTNSSIQASYKSYNGSMTKKLTLDEGDTITFSYQGDDGLSATVSKGDDELLEITDGSTLAVTEKATYDIRVKGKATDGSFLLSWEIANE